MNKARPGRAERVMPDVWLCLRQFMHTNRMLAVDDDIDARDRKDVMWAMSTRMREDVVRKVTGKWSRLGLPDSGKPIWR